MTTYTPTEKRTMRDRILAAAATAALLTGVVGVGVAAAYDDSPTGSDSDAGITENGDQDND